MNFTNQTEEEIEASLTAIANEAVITTITSSYDDPVLTVSGQVTDANGDAVTGRFIVSVFFGEAANNGTPFDFGDLAAESGSVIVVEHTADSICEILTAADGSWGVELTLSASDTVHSNAWVNGRVAVNNSGALTVA